MLKQKRKHTAILRFLAFSLILFIFLIRPLQAQDYASKDLTVDITNINLNQEDYLGKVLLDVGVRVQHKGNGVKGLKAKDFEAFEMIRGDESYLKVHELKKLDSEDADTLSILFLVDVSGSMQKDQRLVLTKEAIKSTMEKTNFSPNTQVFISTFDNDISEMDKISAENISAILKTGPFIQKGTDTDLYRAVLEKSKELNQLPGKKVLVLVSDGKNDVVRNPYYRNNPFIESNEVISYVKEQDDLSIYSIGLGDKLDVAFLKDLAASTGDGSRYVQLLKANELYNVIQKITTSLSSNYKLVLNPKEKIYKGETRKLHIRVKYKGDSEPYILGSINNPVNIHSIENPSTFMDWLIWLLIGTVFIVGLYFVLSKLLPVWNKRVFKQKYVHSYQNDPDSKLIRRDPITQEPFSPGELVVHKCQQPVSLNTWESIGYCPNYPDCMSLMNPCDGSGGMGYELGNFFDQQGANKILNWLWFGALGGLISWVLWALIKITGLNLHVRILESFFSIASVQKMITGFAHGLDILKSLDVFANDILMGVLVSTSLVFMLSWVEESNGRVSWKRVIFRTLLGSLLASVIFFLGVFTQYLLGADPRLFGLLTWLVFGLALGFVLSSFNSTIKRKRGMLSGLFAAFAGFILYFIISYLFQSHDIASKLIGFIALGAVLGFTVISVISTEKDYELETLQPQEFNGHIRSIGKWLENNTPVEIGREAKCSFVIKWNDGYVVPKHAVITSDGGNVYIEALAETLVNNVILPPGKQKIKHGDQIKLGRNSGTLLRFNAKEG